MAYDIYLEFKSSKKETIYDPQVSIPEYIHDYIFYSEFCVRICKRKNLKFFNRMSDLYGQCKYKGSEIDGLIQELNILIPEYFENEQVVCILCKLKVASKKALALNATLAGLGD